MKLFARPEVNGKTKWFPLFHIADKMINLHLYFSQPPPPFQLSSRIFAENLGKIEDGFIDKRFGQENSVREKRKLRAMRLRSSRFGNSFLFESSLRKIFGNLESNRSDCLNEKSLYYLCICQEERKKFYFYRIGKIFPTIVNLSIVNVFFLYKYI